MLVNSVVVYTQTDTVILYESGTVRYAGKILDDFKIGVWYEFNEKGDTTVILEFFDNNDCKITPYNDSRFDYCYYGLFDGDTIVLHGDFYSHDLKRNSSVFGQYSQNKRHSIMFFLSDGRYSNIFDFNSDSNEELLINFYDNQKVKKIYQSKNNLYDGIYMEFDRNGYLIMYGKYAKSNRIGEWVFFEDKMISEIGSYFPDRLFFISTGYGGHEMVNSEGTPASQIYPTEVVESYKLSNYPYYIKNGKWRRFDSNGIVIKVEVYEKGKLVKEEFYEKGELVNTIEY